jgi:hypothetical protein
MSRFFFDRKPAEPFSEPAPPPKPRTDESAVKALMEVQSITASAIFAMLVGKGVLTAAEAAEHMAEIADALELDVRSPHAIHAAETLRSYAGALSAAAG